MRILRLQLHRWNITLVDKLNEHLTQLPRLKALALRGMHAHGNCTCTQTHVVCKCDQNSDAALRKHAMRLSNTQSCFIERGVLDTDSDDKTDEAPPEDIAQPAVLHAESAAVDAQGGANGDVEGGDNGCDGIVKAGAGDEGDVGDGGSSDHEDDWLGG